MPSRPINGTFEPVIRTNERGKSIRAENLIRKASTVGSRCAGSNGTLLPPPRPRPGRIPGRARCPRWGDHLIGVIDPGWSEVSCASAKSALPQDERIHSSVRILSLILSGIQSGMIFEADGRLPRRTLGALQSYRVRASIHSVPRQTSPIRSMRM